VKLAIRPLTDFADQCNRRPAIEWLGVQKVGVAQRSCIDRQIVEPIGTRGQIDAGLAKKLQQTAEVVDAGLFQSGPGANLRTTLASPSALRERTFARSRPSSLDKNPALAQCLVQHRTIEVAPLFDVFGTDDDYIEGYFQPSQLPSQARRLRPPSRHLAGLDDEQIKI